MNPLDRTATIDDSAWAGLLNRLRDGSDRLAALREDQRGRWLAGEAIRVEAYLQRFSDLTDEDALVLIVAEAGLRRDRGETPSAAEYQLRFANLADDISVLFQFASFPIASTLGVEVREHAPPAKPLARDAVPGHLLGDEIGRGGMGIVYRAEDTTLHRSVAVKILQSRFPPQSLAARRFLEEARITGQLQHPGIPPIHQVGSLADGRPFLVMKLIKGRTLAELLNDPTSERSRLVAAFEQLCQAVGYAHSHNVIHRDLKPHNVMVGAFGEVQVLDWGLAKVLTGTGADSVVKQPIEFDREPATEIRTSRDTPDSATEAGSVVGTPAFMSPEQAGGEADKIDRRSDVFGLGAVLCSILTGKPPYVADGADAVRLMSVRGQTGGAYARLDACGADAELIGLAKSCLAPDPLERPADAVELAGIVAGYREALEGRVRQAEIDRVASETRTAEHRKRRRVQLVLAGFVIAAGIVAASAVWWYREDRSAKILADERRQFEVQQDRDRERDEVRREASRKVAASAEKLAYQLTERGFFGEARLSLNSAADGVGQDVPADVTERIEKARKNVEFAAKLDDVKVAYNFSAEPGTERYVVHIAREYGAVFRANGFDPENGEQADFIARAKASPVKGQILAALDDWMLSAPPIPLRIRLWFVTSAIANEPWRGLLATHWTTAALTRELLVKTPREKRTPSLYRFVGSMLEYEFKDPEAYRVFVEGYTQFPTDIWLHFQFALANSRRGKYQEAALAIRTAISLRPNAASLWTLLSAIFRNGKSYPQAIESAKEAISRDPNFWEAHFALAQASALAGDYETARTAARAAAASGRAHGATYARLGYYDLLAAEFSSAAEVLREAVKREPKQTLNHMNLGRALLALGDWEEAEKAFLDEINVNPSLSLAYFHAAILARHRGDHARADELFRRGNSNRPLPVDRELTYFVDLTVQYHNPAVAIRTWEEVVRRAPDDGRFAYVLGLLDARLGKLPEAVRSFKIADELGRKQPDWPYPTAFWLTNYALLAHDFPECIRAGRLGDADFPRFKQHPEHYAHFGWGLLASAKWDESEQAFRRGIDVMPAAPNHQLMQYNLAFVLRRKGDLAGAEAMFRAAANNPSLKPEEQDEQWANLLATCGHLPLHIILFEAALKLTPDDRYVNFTLGAMYRKAGRHADAAKVLAKAAAGPAWNYPAVEWANDSLVRAEADDFLSGKRKPQSPEELLALVRFAAHERRMFESAANVFRQAFKEHSDWSTWPNDKTIRWFPVTPAYYASTCAAQAAAGVGEASRLTEPERAKWRAQTLAWLKADLAWLKARSAAPERTGEVLGRLRYALTDGWLPAVRDPASLQAMPEKDRTAWRQFWKDWAELITTLEMKKT